MKCFKIICGNKTQTRVECAQSVIRLGESTLINKTLVPWARRRSSFIHSLLLVSVLIALSLFGTSFAIANVLNGPSYEVEVVGPVPVPNPDSHGSGNCAGLGMPGGFPYAAGVELSQLAPDGSSAVANATTVNCYSANMILFVPKDTPKKQRPAVLMLHGDVNAIPLPGLIDTQYAMRLASKGIVVAYYDWPPFQINGYSQFGVPSVRMSGALDSYIHRLLNNVYFTDAFIGFTASEESVLVGYDWLVNNAETYGIDPDAIGAVGDSLGSVLALNNYGFGAVNVTPADFKFQILMRPCYALPPYTTGIASACSPPSDYEDIPLVGPPMLAVSGTLDSTFRNHFMDSFVESLQANGIPVEYERYYAQHDFYPRYLGWKLADRHIQFINAVTKNEGCLNSHELVNGNSACHLLGFVESPIDNLDGSYDSCLSSENRVAYDGHTYGLCTGYEADQWPRNFYDAKTLCESKGGYLVQVDNAAEQQFLFDWKVANGIEFNRGPWVDPQIPGACQIINGANNIVFRDCTVNPNSFVCEFE